MILLLGIVSSLLLLIAGSSMLGAWNIDSWVLHPAIVVMAHVTLRRPFHEAAITVVILGWAADSLASGPAGVHGLVLTLVFFAMSGVARSIGGRFNTAAFLLALCGSLALDLSEALLLSIFYPEFAGLSLFARTALFSALATGVVAVAYSLGMVALENLWVQRTQRSVMVD